MENDSCDELTKSIRLPQMKLLKIEIELDRMLNRVWWMSRNSEIILVNVLRIKNMTREIENETLSVMGCWARLPKTS